MGCILGRAHAWVPWTAALGSFFQGRANAEIHKFANRPPSFPKISGHPFGGPHNKDSSTLGSILGSPC